MFLFVGWLILVSTGCIPNLDPPECSASRTTVREFYSFHFANEMSFSEEGLKKREHYLTPEMVQQLGNAAEGTDPFTTGDGDFPKAFRPGECRVISPDRTVFDVLIFWKDDTRSEQRSIKVTVQKIGDKWLIDKVER